MLISASASGVVTAQLLRGVMTLTHINTNRAAHWQRIVRTASGRIHALPLPVGWVGVALAVEPWPEFSSRLLPVS